MRMKRATNCCGLVEIDGINEIPRANLRTLTQDIDNHYIDKYRTEVSMEGGGAFSIILTHDYWITHEPAVLEAGFRHLYSFNNPRTNNDCRVYFKTIHKVNRKKT